MEESQLALSSLQDLETGQRGYLITHDSAFLQPYEAGRKEVWTHMDELARLTSDNPTQQVNLETLRDLAVKRVNRAADMLVLGQRSPASKELSQGMAEGRRIMDAFRAQCKVLMDEEGRLLKKRQDDLAITQNISSVLIALLCIVGAGVLFWTGRTVQQFVSAEEASKKEIEKIAALLDVNEDPIFVRDTNNKITYWNKGAETTYGYTQQEALGKSPYELLQTEFPTTVSRIDEELAAKSRWEGQLEHKTKEGRKLFIASRWLKQNDNSILEANRNVTDRVEREQKLKVLTAQLTRSNEDLQQFAYVASHDLQEPLRAVIGFMTLLNKRLEGKLQDEEKEWLGHAVDGAQRMRTLVNDLLTFSRVDSQGQPLEAGVDLNAVVKVAINNLSTLVEECGAVIEYDKLPRVTGDKGQLAQLMQNLIGNGLKYRSPDRKPAIKIESRSESGRQIVSVADNGIGFDMAHSKRIFVIFQRLHSRADHPGTGIGLALCKRIVERHKGEIWCDSKVGEGSTFFVSLPQEKGT